MAGIREGRRIGARASEKWAMNGRLRAPDEVLRGGLGGLMGVAGGGAAGLWVGGYAAAGRGGRSSLYAIYFPTCPGQEVGTGWWLITAPLGASGL